MPVEPSLAFQRSFIALVLLTAAGAIWFVYRVFALHTNTRDAGRAALFSAAGLASLMAITAGVTTLDGLRAWDQLPPPILAPFLGVTLVTLALCTRTRGARVLATASPLCLLIGLQSFRVLVELMLHWGYIEGLVPVQMTYAGQNFDILSGLGALVIGVWAARASPPRWLVWSWNLGGLALLLNVVVVAVLSMPTPMRHFMNEPANVWVSYAPYIWLPTILVQIALAGHILLFRRLFAEAASSSP
jgi:hypothetical protein